MTAEPTPRAVVAAAAVAPATTAIRSPGLLAQLRQILGALYASPLGKTLLSLAIGIVVVVAATSYGQIRLNAWNKAFYDALSRRDLKDFMFQLGVFALIAGVLLILNVGQRWLTETLKVRLREGLVSDLVGHWMVPRRAFWLAHAGEMGVNPDQRMTDDTMVLCNLSTDLAVGLLQATILFVSFAGILWVLSEDFSFRIGGADYAVPGFMLWAAVIYAGFGSLLSYFVGRSLIGRSSNRYAREADLRFSLVRINEHLDGISLASGEADERRRIESSLGDVIAAMRRLVRGWTNLTWVTAGFGWITIVAPIVVAAPLFFSGKLSFGGLMAAAAAFTQAQTSLRWFVDNFSIIADWRATLLRVAGFRQALTANEKQLDFDSRITYVEGAPGTLKIANLKIESPAGRDMLKEQDIVISAGERVLITADAGTGKTLLFRALAALWPWGAGQVTSPAGEQIFYMPRGTPYLPSGTLREILAYPLQVSSFADASYARSLQRLGLERLVSMLDSSRRWDRELSQDEQLSLAFARIVLQAPPWVLIDDAFGSLDDDVLAHVVDVFAKELAHTGVIHIGGSVQGKEAMFSRVLHLVKTPASAS
ncbi:MAG: transporter domain protein [Hydrocarboniphaga sp.]|uniref:ABC transporter ATP-binding protein/permease n=1 Tax=Hydrocarboniphaga sp. TaxID=2033016 RepID=UPI002614C4B9|nr:ABC transporter ATP-binding protein/permease [Hydrocarboniphaga sp.]MDB5971250.1 transporter domain protein [Hydrocarboniphaga sp.]